MATRHVPALALDMLSDYLPYRYFDAERQLFLNAASSGFVLAAAPLVGADERTGEILGQFFSEGIAAGASLQIVKLRVRASAASSRPGSAPLPSRRCL